MNKREKGKKQLRKLRREGIIRLILIPLVLLIIGFLPMDSIQAAKADVSSIPFTDNSGKYLQKINNQWFLKNSDGEVLSGVQPIKIKKTEGLLSGYYMFSKKGMLVKKSAVYYFQKQKVGNVTFKGYHYTNTEGRFLRIPRGLIYIENETCNGKQFNGIFYIGDYGRLSTTAQMRKISAKKVGGVLIASGYYYFNSSGMLCRNAAFRSLRQQTDGKKFAGTYYFGGKNGALYRKAGWITYKNNKYYLSSTGKRYEKCWKSGYYLLSDGTIAKNQRLPNGSYVDCDGHKCTAEEMKLSPLKKQLETLISSYQGTWSVYIKDLKTGDIVNLNEKAMYPASVIKPFVMASTFQQIKEKQLSYNSTVKNLLSSMITVSDNESYNELVRLNSPSRDFVSGAAVVNRYLKKNGYSNTGCHSTLHPATSSFKSDGSSNTSSAKDCGVLLENIYKGTCVSSAYSKEMLNLLLSQTRRWKIPASLPSGTKVANKTGETSVTQHDMAIVYAPKTTYIVCIFSTNISEYNGINGIKNISKYVYNYLNR